MRTNKEQSIYKLSCIDCGITFDAKSTAALRCPQCRKIANCERSKLSRKKGKSRVIKKSPLFDKSMGQVLNELAEYNRIHKTRLTYGQYVQLMEKGNG